MRYNISEDRKGLDVKRIWAMNIDGTMEINMHAYTNFQVQ
jgi:hypothetical protein